ncbi:MAG: hypothetical protein JWO22_1299 [Frankiales bacterium]|nr:hypothetical protein [Frankiales bacterium]
MPAPPGRAADATASRAYGRLVTVIPEQRSAQERLWRAITLLDAIDQPGSDLPVDRGEAELELVMAWSEYETSRLTD